MLIEIIVSALAVFRFAELLAIDEITLPLRERLGVYDLGENGKPKTFIGKLFECPYCLAIWLSFICALYFDRSLTLPLTWFAIAGGQAFLQTLGGRNAYRA
jgi:hypothetical protein